jgi:hypothetical protein
MSYENGMWSNATGDSILSAILAILTGIVKYPNQHLCLLVLLLLNGSSHPKSWQLLNLTQLGLYGDFEN